MTILRRIRNCLLLSFSTIFCRACSCSSVVSETVKCCDGLSTIRYHYDVMQKECRDAFLVLGVGTAMNTENYDRIAQATVAATPHIVVIILDAEPYVPVKQGPKPFARAVDALAVELGDDLIPELPVCETPLKVLVGGHSASGAAAYHAVRLEYFFTPIVGYLGLDPFFIPNGQRSTKYIGSWWHERVLFPTSKPQISLPSVYWGFSETTCSVAVEHAAWAAYNQTWPHRRVFYQLRPPFSHCCFTDAGCYRICQCNIPTDVLHHDVALSVHHLLEHIESGNSAALNPINFDGNDFQLEKTTFEIFMDGIGMKQVASVPLADQSLSTAEESYPMYAVR